MTYRGRVKNGVIVLDDLVDLPDGTAVDVSRVEGDTPRPSLHERYKDLIGIADGLPPDMAENHDHYIHGAPKQST